MSAYVVSDKTINRIVSFLKIICDEERVLEKWKWTGKVIKNLLCKNGYGDDSGHACDYEKLAEDLFALNVKSVEGKYGKDNSLTKDVSFDFDLCHYASPVRVVKSIACWVYQSCESGCDDDPLFKLLKEIRLHIFDILAMI